MRKGCDWCLPADPQEGTMVMSLPLEIYGKRVGVRMYRESEYEHWPEKPWALNLEYTDHGELLENDFVFMRYCPFCGDRLEGWSDDGEKEDE